MGYSLAPNTGFCFAGKQATFFNVEADDYFCLSLDATRSFAATLSSDNSADEDPDVWHSLMEGGLVLECPGPNSGFENFALASTDSIHGRRPSKVSAFSFLQALTDQLAAERDLQRLGLRRAIGRLGKIDRSKNSGAPTRDDDLIGTAYVFYLSKRLLPTTNKCLSRSLALTRRLHKNGIAANLIIGVRTMPFSAHAWVQFNETVLNDYVEDIQRYTPIWVA